MIAIRRFAAEDAEALRRGLYPDMALSEVSEMIAEWNTCEYGGRRFDAFAVVSDERIVGYVSLYEQSRSVVSAGAEIFADERGRGAAAEAVRLLLRYASEQGYRIVFDQVRADNAASIRLHEKLGFESDGCVYRNRRGREVLLFLISI